MIRGATFAVILGLICLFQPAWLLPDVPGRDIPKKMDADSAAAAADAATDKKDAKDPAAMIAEMQAQIDALKAAYNIDSTEEEKDTDSRPLVTDTVTGQKVRASGSNLGPREYGVDIDWNYGPWAFNNFEDWNKNTKPWMFLITRSDSDACNFLKATMESQEGPMVDVEAWSKEFHMIHILDSEIGNFTLQKQTLVDGAYVPRIYFADPKGNMVKEAHNAFGHSHARHHYMHYYKDAAEVRAGMEHMRHMIHRDEL
mmetsp:Transcript_40398/g.48985  ORF Transcript_40398/g.48985 Transcript_40398/m.48985 type:complete len:256 (-) Transcript_40398:465-1232(-)|eukprot:CAMPEP_0197844846 /NCGR_PEP_ID=MMETSP1438-20131217/1822_1 /TAXON_ID=1461541 /ORGANISM="Pterosperma sp., Strain CCMP1384" /LENGTH=255 /DNA_ID=CAMNT_0043455849 /DNA_START=102 /DNA_END=869 /DNA_ORIENTATION=-